MSEVSYEQLNLSSAMMQAIAKKGYVNATSVQAQSIPHFLEWKDVIAKAPTGTGKTYAFGIPMIEHIDPELHKIQGLILAPTRELAIQIRDELHHLCSFV
ncbi:MAG: DEAD/DEAH box helicase, partial [Eubacteriales bacterium]